MYIIYTFVNLPVLLICQILWAVTLLMPRALEVKALSFRFRARLGFLLKTGNIFAFLLASTLGLIILSTFLEISALIDHQHLMFLLDLHFYSLKH
jgi:hypothetical protein